LGDPRAVDVDPQLRRAGRLLHAHVGQAPDGLQAGQELGGVGAVGGGVGAGDLQVDRGRGAEVEDLADDVGRQEREGRARELAGQHLAQGLHIGGRSGGARLQATKMSPSCGPITPELL
jgi:hypothetical protein